MRHPAWIFPECNAGLLQNLSPRWCFILMRIGFWTCSWEWPWKWSRPELWLTTRDRQSGFVKFKSSSLSFRCLRWLCLKTVLKLSSCHLLWYVGMCYELREIRSRRTHSTTDTGSISIISIFCPKTAPDKMKVNEYYRLRIF